MERPWKTFYPPSVEPNIVIPTMPLFSLLKRAWEEQPDGLAVVDGEVRWSYRDLYKNVVSFASSLWNKGFRPGDRCVLMLFNCKEYIITYFAVMKLGGTVVQANPLHSIEELKRVVNDSEAKWIVTEAKEWEKVHEASKHKETVRSILTCDGSIRNGALCFEEMVRKGQGGRVPDVNIDPERDIAVFQYTGGTTGKSKAAMLSHQNILSNVCQNEHFTVKNLSKADEKLLGVLPFYHVYGMSAVLLLAVYRGSTVICIRRFDPKHLLTTIKNEKPTLFSGVPTMYMALLQQEEATPETMQSLKLCMAGSAPLPKDVIRVFEEKTGADILEGYGLSETSPTTHRNPVGGLRKVGSIGIPVPNTDCRIVDQVNGNCDMPVGEIGELVIKGPQVMKGYLNQEEETRLALRDGWLFTGDLAYMDPDGYFFIVGRKKDLIIASGYNVYPTEIEDVLYQHPAVIEAAVYGVYDDYRGETVHASIVFHEATSIDPSQLKKWLKKRIANYKVPTHIDVRTSLPRSGVGKLLKTILRDEAEQNRKQKEGSR
ncbi:long-chain-fatty-acid--CoA ligase [Alteribacter aurantiacus]|uniref:long-chain-fatty-acid--CoA ligase n=1 Tax=Alteribacter aurantiacus TaxID=254410 RepID=UPI00041A9154|nr:long-chain fatty acid--CoA ligase [Alteribacter aurantiacus]